MEVTIEHLFACIMISIIALTCISTLSSIASNYIDLASKVRRKDVASKIASLIAPKDAVDEFLIESMSRSHYMSPLTYDSLKSMLELEDYSFHISITPALKMDLQLKNKTLYFTIKNRVTNSAVPCKVRIYAFKDGAAILSTLLESPSGEGIYEFNSSPDFVVAYAVNDLGFFGFNYTGIGVEVESLIVTRTLKLTPIVWRESQMLIAPYSFWYSCRKQISTLVFTSPPLRHGLKIMRGSIKLAVPLKGTGKIRAEFSVLSSDGLKRFSSSSTASISFSEVSRYELHIPITRDIAVNSGDEFMITLECLEGQVELYFLYDETPTLEIPLAGMEKYLMVESPAKPKAVYILTPRKMLTIAHFTYENGFISLPYIAPPLIVIHYLESKYYLSSIPPETIQLGSSNLRGNARLFKLISLNGYLLALLISLEQHKPLIKTVNPKLGIKVHPSRVMLRPGRWTPITLYISGADGLRASLNAEVSSSSIEVILQERVVHVPCTISAVVKVDSESPPGIYHVIFKAFNSEFSANAVLTIIVRPERNDRLLLSVEPGKLILKPNSIAQVTIRARLLSGACEEVFLSAYRVPQHITVSLNPEIGTTPLTSICKIHVGSLQPGKYILVVKGITRSSLEAYATLTLEVKEQREGYFKLSVYPSSVYTWRNRIARVTITVTPIGEFNGFVRLEVEDLPKYTIAYFSSPSGIPPFKSSLSIYVSSLVRPGTYIIKVIGRSDKVIEEVQFKLRILR